MLRDSAQVGCCNLSQEALQGWDAGAASIGALHLCFHLPSWLGRLALSWEVRPGCDSVSGLLRGGDHRMDLRSVEAKGLMTYTKHMTNTGVATTWETPGHGPSCSWTVDLHQVDGLQEPGAGSHVAWA